MATLILLPTVLALFIHFAAKSHKAGNVKTGVLLTVLASLAGYATLYVWFNLLLAVAQSAI